MNRRNYFFGSCLFLSLLVSAHQVLAGDAAASAAVPVQPGDKPALQQVREELADLERRWYGLTRFRFSYPQKFSAGFGMILAQQPRDTDCATGCMVQGWHFEIEPGMYGIQGSVGWGRLVGETGRTKRLMYKTHFGWAVRGVFMRTWGDWRDTDFPVAKTLAGVEGSVTIVRMNFSLGLLRSLSSDATDDWQISAGAGFGF